MARSTQAKTTQAGKRSAREIRPLDRELIVERAVALAEEHGASALSLRRLGEDLGVDATAIYRHFRDKDDLVLAMGDHVTAWVLTRMIEVNGETTDWRELLRILGRLAWQSAATFPATHSLTFGRTTGREAERQMVELLLSRLREIGLDEARTVLVYRSFADVMLALSGMNATLESLDPRLQAKDDAAWSNIYAVLPHETFPATRDHAAALVAITDEAIYEFTLESLIQGIERMAASSGGRTGSVSALGRTGSRDSGRASDGTTRRDDG